MAEELGYFTILWSSLEAVAASISGLIAGSAALVGFNLDSFAALRIPLDEGVVGPSERGVELLALDDRCRAHKSGSTARAFSMPAFVCP
jgi:hypothetical protein